MLITTSSSNRGVRIFSHKKAQKSGSTLVVPASPFALGVVRFFVHGVFLFDTVFESYSALGSLPATILRPTGVMKFLPWSFYDALQTPRGMLTLKTLMLVS